MGWVTESRKQTTRFTCNNCKSYRKGFCTKFRVRITDVHNAKVCSSPDITVKTTTKKRKVYKPIKGMFD